MENLSREELKALIEKLEDSLLVAKEYNVNPPEWAIEIIKNDIAKAKLTLLLLGEPPNEN